MDISIEKIVLKLGKKEIHLTVEEAKELHSVLKDTFFFSNPAWQPWYRDTVHIPYVYWGYPQITDTSYTVTCASTSEAFYNATEANHKT